MYLITASKLNILSQQRVIHCNILFVIQPSLQYLFSINTDYSVHKIAKRYVNCSEMVLHLSKHKITFHWYVAKAEQ